MHRLVHLLRSLGNAGAVANVQAALDARRAEAWLVQGLVARLDARDAAAASPAPAPSRAPAAA